MKPKEENGCRTTKHFSESSSSLEELKRSLLGEKGGVEIKRRNFSFNLLKRIPHRDRILFEECNLAQAKPFTELPAFIHRAIFVRCNLLNIKIGPKMKAVNCLETQKEMCSHNATELSKRGAIPECPLNCGHIDSGTKILLGKDELTIRRKYKERIYNCGNTVR